MTTGSFAINGTDLLIQPSEIKFVPRTTLAIDGAGHPIYSAIREIEIDYDIFDQATWKQLQDFYNGCGNTGSVVINAPSYAQGQFSYIAISGATMGEPEMGGDFLTPDGYLVKMKVVFMNVRV